jgi:hypothetical protein
MTFSRIPPGEMFFGLSYHPQSKISIYSGKKDCGTADGAAAKAAAGDNSTPPPLLWQATRSAGLP